MTGSVATGTFYPRTPVSPPSPSALPMNPCLVKSLKLLPVLVASVLFALTTRAQLQWSEYSDLNQTINGTSYTAGALVASNVAAGGDTLTGGASATVSFTVPAGAYVDFATSNFTPLTVSSSNTSAKVNFTMSASGGLTTASRVFAVGLLNTSSSALTHTGYSAVANLGNSGVYELYAAPASGTTATGGGMLQFNSATKLNSGKSIAFASFANGTTYTGFFQINYVGGNVQIGTSSSPTSGAAGISLANDAAIDSAYGTNTSTGYPNPTFTVNTFVFSYFNSGSSPVTLTLGSISLAPLGSPTITTQPSSVATAVGASATFSVTAAANPAATYQWYLGGTALANGPLADGSVVSGATSSTLTINNAQLDENGAGVMVVATNSYGSATSTAATLTVAQTSTPPSITTQPASASVNAGTTATFTVGASGSPAPGYQWYFTPTGGSATALTDGNGITGSATATLRITTVNPQEAGAYYAVATNLGGTATSSSATLTVVNAGPAISAVSPSGAGAAACVDTPLSITFSSPILIGTAGKVRIYNASTHALVDTIDVGASSMTAAQVLSVEGIEAITSSKTIEGQAFNYYPIVVTGSTAVVYPHVALGYNTSYYVTIDTGVFVDATSKNAFIGIYDATTWAFKTKAAGPAAGSTWLNVAADGTGDFCTVQGALDFLPNNSTTATTIYIASGTYYGIVFDNGRSNVTFLGQSRPGTVLAYANNNTFDSAGGSFYHRGAVEAYGNGLAFLNLTIRNTTPHGGSQAEALILIGSKNIISDVNLYSYQDTLQATGTTYIANSTIQGDVDYMWGYGANYFYNCHLTAVTNGAYFAQVRNSQPSGTTNHGNVYVNCTLDAAAGVTGCYLARIDPTPTTGFPYSEMVLIKCALGNDLASAGWLLNNATSAPSINWAYSGLTNLDGTPFNTSGWSYATALTDPTALQNYQTPSYVLSGWSPALSPIIVAQPTAQAVNYGGGTTLSVTAYGVPALTYQWYRNGTAIAGATSATYSIASAGGSDAGTYTVAIGNGTTTTTSSAVTLVVNGGPPVITTNPQSQTALLGGSTSFAVAATNGPVTYQWYKDGVALIGATGQSLTLFGLQASDAGNYIVAVTNSGSIGSGTVVSNAATLTLVAPASATAPTFPTIPNVVFSATAYGAVGDGATDNTAALQAAINAAKAAGGGIVELPPASAAYLTGPLTLSSNIDLQIDGGATLQALPYGTYPNSTTSPANLITVNSGSSNVAITGAGTIDGQGAAWWSAYSSGTISNRPRLIQINKSTNVLVNALTLQNSPMFHIAMTNVSSNVTFFALTINTSGTSPNTDGIDPTGSNILIQGCSIADGDDNIAVKCINAACSNITIANCAFGVGHGVSVGGQTNLGLNGMVVTNCTFTGTTSGLRLKADATQGGLVQNVTCSNLTMTNVAYPIVFYSYYNQVGTPGATSGSSQTTPAKVNAWNATLPNSLATTTVPAWQNITISNLTATGATGYSTIWGLPLANGLIANVTLDNVAITGGAGLELYDATDVQFTGTNSLGPIVTANALAITGQPVAQTVTAGGTASFSVTATGASGLNASAPVYQWAINGVALADGLQADGSVVSGANTATLTLTNARVTNAGNVTCTVSNTLDGYDTTTLSLVANSLPVAATSRAAALTVNPAPATIALSDLAPTYDGTPKVPTVATMPAGVAVALTFNGSAGAPTAAGSYAVVATIADPNYTGPAANGTLTIAKAAPTIAVTPYAVAFDGTAHTATGTATGAQGEALVGLALAATVHTNAGMYTDAWTFTDASGNYLDATGTVGDAIAPANATIAVAGYTGVYDGRPHGASGTATGVGGTDLSALLNLGAAFSNVPGGSAAWAFHDPAGNYSDASGSVAIVLGPAAANVTVTGYAVTYDGGAHTATGSVQGVSGETLAGLALGGTTHTDAGTYTDRWTFTDVTGNYANASGSVTDKIAPAAATILLAPLAQSYDGAPKSVTATTSPANLAVSVTYDGAATVPTLPGDYTVVATITDPNYSGTETDTLSIDVTALVRHGLTLNGEIDGSVQVLLGENSTLNGNAGITGDLLVPGAPAIQLNGHPTFAGVTDNAGTVTTAPYTVTLNGRSLLRNLVRGVDPLALPGVDTPPAPAGTRDVVLNGAGSIGDPSTLRNLTLNGKAGLVAVPPGTYGSFTANGNGFILGIAGTTEPVVYNLQSLTLNSSAQVQVVGPVIVVLANGVAVNAGAGASAHPEWLTIEVANGGLTLNNGDVYGSVVAPTGTVTLNGGAQLTGTVTTDRLVVNGSAALVAPAP